MKSFKRPIKALVAALSLVIAFSPFSSQFSPSLHAQTVLTATQDNAHYYGAPVTVDITDDGHVSISGAQIVQIANTAFFARLYWGSTFLRVTILTGTSTAFTKKYGENIDLSDISVGDYVSASGTLYGDSSVFDLNATSFKDWSIQTQTDEFSGAVTSVTPSPAGFMLMQKNGSSLAVACGTTTVITRGSLTLSPSQINVGDTILNASGVYDHATNTLYAQNIKIYQDMSIFQPHNFAGTITSISSQTLPSIIQLSVPQGGTTVNYTVSLAAGSTVMSANRALATFGRFLVGDSVRVYGSIRENNHQFIDASVIRDLDL